MGSNSKKLTNPMQRKGKAKCGARCRSTGEPCKNYQMANGRCRMHGGKSTGRPTTTGLHTKEAKQERKEIRELVKAIKNML